MYAYTRIYSIFIVVCAIITVEMDSKLTDQIFLEFGGDIDLEISRPNDKLPMFLQYIDFLITP